MWLVMNSGAVFPLLLGRDVLFKSRRIHPVQRSGGVSSTNASKDVGEYSTQEAVRTRRRLVHSQATTVSDPAPIVLNEGESSFSTMDRMPHG